MDEFIYDASNQTAEHNYIVASKNWTYQADSQNGSYSQQTVQLDCVGFANNAEKQAWQTAILTIPLVGTIASDTAGVLVDTPENYYAFNLKNGMYNLIQGLSIKMQENDVVTQLNYPNILTNYKLLNEMSTTDLVNFGPSLQFYPDDIDSVVLNSGVDQGQGFGICNNKIQGSSQFDVTRSTQFVNSGRVKRIMYSNLNGNDTQTAALGGNNINGTNTVAAAGVLNGYYNSEWRNTVQFVPNGGNGYYQYNILAQIRLADLSDFIDKLPLFANGKLSFTFYHNCNCSVNQAINYSVPLQTGGVQQYPTVNGIVTTYNSLGNCIPFNLSPINATPPNVASSSPLAIEFNGTVLPNSAVGSSANSTGFNIRLGTILTSAHAVITNAVVNLTSSLYIAKNPNTGGSNMTMSGGQCRIYMDMYKLTIAYDGIYRQNPIKEIKFEDYQCYFTDQNLVNVPPLATRQVTLSSDKARVRKLYVMLMRNSSMNGSSANNNNIVLPEMFSPYSSAPSTNGAQCEINQVNVLVNNIPIYRQALNQTYDNYINEFRPNLSIDGGMNYGLSSGLVSQRMYESGLYKVYVFDLQNHEPSFDDTQTKVDVQFTNCGNVTFDAMAFLTFEKSVFLNTDIGQLVK